MKKLMTLMLGLSFLTATAFVAQAQVPAEKSDTAKKAPKKSKKSTEEKSDTAKKAPKKAKKSTEEKK